ncbi:MAG: 7-cyano-7-deazaguanine synthase [Clostridia bacterium]|nr:7-cyano-7-deazaguanine synthase [Clostridia bacterium]
MNRIANKCYVNDGVYFRGFAFLENTIQSGHELSKKLSVMNTPEEIISFISKLNGSFSIIVDTDEFTLAFQDHFSTYHLCYSLFNQELYISDSVNYIVKMTSQQNICQDGYSDLVYTGYINFNETFVENIYKLMPSEYILFDKKTSQLSRDKYFKYTYVKENIYDDSSLTKRFDKVVDNVIGRLKTRLNKRQCVLMLSGGVDSRFCAMLLKKMNYENTILVTYGSKHSEEYQPAVKAAEKLGFKHVFIKHNRREWANVYEEEESLDYVDYASNMMVTAHLREHFVIRELLTKNIIQKNAIIVPGHLGNVAGRSFYSEEMLNISLTPVMYRSRMMFYDYKNMESVQMKYLKERVKCISDEMSLHKDFYDLCQAYERFSLDSYTVLYLINSVRAYDFYGLEWHMPLLDNDILDFFSHVSIEKKYMKKFLYEYVDSFFGPIPYASSSKNYFLKVVRNILDERYSCIHFFKAVSLVCDANRHLPLIKRLYRYYRNFSCYCAVIETDLMKKQLNK